MLIDYKLGQGSIVLRVKLRSTAVTTFAGLTGLSSSSAGLNISVIADNESATVAYTQAASNIQTIATLGTYAAPSASKCRFQEVDSTNHKGIYEIQIADARFGVSSAKSLIVSISGATNLAECDVCIPLRSLDPYDGIRAGLTALPNAAAGASGGVHINGSNSGTTTLAALTITGTLTVSDGVVVTRSSSNSIGLSVTGNGSGSGATFAAGATGVGISITTTAGDGLSITPTAGNAIVATANGTSKHGVQITGGTAGTSDGLKMVAGTGGVGVRLDTLTASGAVTLSSTLTVSGATSLAAFGCTTLTASGAVAFQSTFAVTTSTSLGALSATTITASGAVAFQSTFAVTTSTSLAALSATTITASGTTSLAAVTTSGAVTLNALTVSNNALISGTLTVTGATTFTGAVVGTNASNDLRINGIVPGAAGGVFIAGTNAATVITTSLTTHFVGTVDTVTTYTGNTPQTGDAFARVGAPVGASLSADVAAVKADTAAVKAKTDNLPSDPADASDIASAFSTVNSTLGTIAGYLDTEIAAILADTNELQTDWVNGGRLDLILDARASQASVDDLPTNTELATALGTADDAVLAQIALVKATTDQFVFTVANQVDANALTGGIDEAGVRTAVGLASANLDTQLSGIQSDTNDIQTRIPAALVSGRIDASVGAMASGVVTAAAVADGAIDAATFAAGAINAAAIADGAIDAATFAAGAINAAAIASDAITDAKVASDVTIASVTGNIGGNVVGNVGGDVIGSVGSVTARVTANTDQLAGQAVTAGSGVAFPASVASPTNITAASGVVLSTACVQNIIEECFTYDATATYATAAAGSLVAQIADNSAGGLLTVSDIVDGILDELIAGHSDAGSVAAAISSILQDTNELQTNQGNWLTATGFATPGNVTGAVTALETYGDAHWTTATGFSTFDPTTNVVAHVTLVDTCTTNTDMRGTDNAATAANLATVAGYLDTEIAAILADTNELQTDWVDGGRLDLILDARASQTSVDDLPTNTELATALGTADDATLAAIAALNDLSAADVNAECDTALTDYGAAKPGDEMDLIDAPNATAITAIQAGLATAASVSDLSDQIGTSGSAASIGEAVDVAIAEASAANAIVSDVVFGNEALSNLIPSAADIQEQVWLNQPFKGTADGPQITIWALDGEGNPIATASALGTLTTTVGADGAGLTAIPDSAGVTTLLARLPAAFFAGITSLAKWLGIIAGKTADAGTLAEITATTGGAGYLNSTDSLEAIRDRGDVAWTTADSAGVGARLVTITVDDGTDPLDNAIVRVTQGAESYSQTTNASGIAVFSLNDATWTVTITKALYGFTPTTIVVNGTETATYSMTATVVIPTVPGLTTGYITITDTAGDAVEGAVVEVEVTRWANGTTGSGITPRMRSETTDASGYAEFTGLPRLATYRVRVNGGEWTSAAVTLDATTTPLTAPIGPIE